jgi:hypothetical protein
VLKATPSRVIDNAAEALRWIEVDYVEVGDGLTVVT